MIILFLSSAAYLTIRAIALDHIISSLNVIGTDNLLPGWLIYGFQF